jgi:hypothetical protein
MILSRNDPRPLVITWITVCIALSDSIVARLFAMLVSGAVTAAATLRTARRL